MAAGTKAPAWLLAEVHALTTRAARAGRPLRPLPTVEVGGAGRSSVLLKQHPPRLLLSKDLLDLPVGDRAWTIAHELSHVLRHQEGTIDRGPARWPLAAATVTTVVGLIGTALAAATVTSGLLGVRFALVLLVGLVGVGVWALLQLATSRREESATDRTAAVVFGQVMSQEWVRRTLDAEGILNRRGLVLLRSHPRPQTRRQAALLAADRAPATTGHRPRDGRNTGSAEGAVPPYTC